MSTHERKHLAAVLEWTLAMGADAVVAEEPIDWLAPDRLPPGSEFALDGGPLAGQGSGSGEREPATMSPSPISSAPGAAAASRPGAAAPPSRPAGPRRFATPPPDVAVGTARSAAHKARTLDELRQALEAFDGCSLKATAKNLCFFRGAPAAPLMIVGEAPGRDEDMEGKPFVGRAGQLLDRMLTAIGLGDDGVHITNVVYWRPPGNRTPTPQEAEVCRPFLDRQIELVQPRVLLLLGGVAAKQVLRVEEGILTVRGRWREIEIAGRKVPTMASLHPAYLLRTPAAKRQAWKDLLAVRQALTNPEKA
jgi:DNA polymerase